MQDISTWEKKIDFTDCNTPDELLMKYESLRKLIISSVDKDVMNKVMIMLNKARSRRLSELTAEKERIEKGVVKLYDEIPFDITSVTTLTSILPIQNENLRSIIEVDSNGVLHL